jgi:hypothetical protein
VKKILNWKKILKIFLKYKSIKVALSIKMPTYLQNARFATKQSAYDNNVVVGSQSYINSDGPNDGNNTLCAFTLNHIKNCESCMRRMIKENFMSPNVSIDDDTSNYAIIIIWITIAWLIITVLIGVKCLR